MSSESCRDRFLGPQMETEQGRCELWLQYADTTGPVMHISRHVPEVVDVEPPDLADAFRAKIAAAA